jgi:hypothetical protein
MPYPLETILNKYCVKGKEAYFKYLFFSKINTLYSFYIQSKRYKKEIESMKKKKDIKIVLLYQFVSENFVNYYYYSKPHPHLKRKRKTELKNNDNNCFNNNNINNNILNINNIEISNEKSNIIIDCKEYDSGQIQELQKKQS